LEYKKYKSVDDKKNTPKNQKNIILQLKLKKKKKKKEKKK